MLQQAKSFKNLKKLSVVIPVYRAEAFIKKTLTNYKKEIDALSGVFFENYEIILIVDGEVDKTNLLAKKIKGIRVFSYLQNKGKGYALRQGFLRASGDLILMIDADGDFSLKQIANFFPYLETADIVVGSKRHPFSKIVYPMHRRFLSRGFQVLSKIVLGISLRDTQSGIKIVKREVLDILWPSLLMDRFSFDLEMCFLAQKHGFRTVEAPVSLQFEGKSTIRLLSVWRMFWDVLRIRCRFSITCVYQQRFQKEKFK